MGTLITGAGMVGCQAAKELVRSGDFPVLYDANPQRQSVSETVELSSIKLVEGDLLDFPELIRTLRTAGTKIIIHTAALLTAAMKSRPYSGLQVNIMGTAQILEAARLLDIEKIIYTSSSTVYAWNAEQTTLNEPVREDYPLKPGSVYAASKIACENIGIAYAREYGLKFITVRFPMVFGPWSGAMGGTGGLLVRELIMKPLKGEPVAIEKPFGSDEFLYSKDAGRALALMATSKSIGSGVYNIGMGKMVAFDEVLEILRGLIPGAEYRIRDTGSKTQSGGYYPRPQPFDIAKAKEQLGFAPVYDMRSGLMELVGWARSKIERD